MINVRFKALDTVAEWVWFKTRVPFTASEDSQGIVAMLGDDIVAICVADGFNKDSCNVHYAIDNPMVIRRGFLNEVFRHLFITCGKKRVFGLVPANNQKALKLDLHIGFSEVCRIPDGFETGIDYVVIRMDREDCRWICAADEDRRAA